MDNNTDWLLKRMGADKEVSTIIATGQVTGVTTTNAPNNNIVLKQNESIENVKGREILNNQDNVNGLSNYENSRFNRNPNQNSLDKFTVKQKVQMKLNDEMQKEKNSEIPDDNFLKTMIDKFLAEYSIPQIMKMEITQEIIWDLKGYGIIQPLLDDESITEIICCTYDNVWIEKGGRMIKTDYKFSNEKELRNLIDKIVQPLGRRIDDAQPYVNARLKDRSRVNVVIDPIAADGATLDIRKFAKQVFTMKDYVDKKSMIREMTEFIKWITITRKNIVVSGGTGSGKTTLLNCVSRFIPENEAIVTIEDLLELQLVQPCVRSLEARGPNAEGKGAITIRDLVVNSLRMRPDRLIIGECRSFEVVDMLQAMNTGHDGSLTTVHANSAKEAIDRLTTMYQMAGLGVPDVAIKSQIATAVNVFIQAKRLDDGSRKIIQISEVLGLGRRGAEKNNDHIEEYGLDPSFYIKGVNNSEVYIQDIFRYSEEDEKFIRTGWIPTFFKQLQYKGCPLTLSDFSHKEFSV